MKKKNSQRAGIYIFIEPWSITTFVLFFRIQEWFLFWILFLIKYIKKKIYVCKRKLRLVKIQISCFFKNYLNTYSRSLTFKNSSV